MTIYLDNAATTPIHPKVIAYMSQLMKDVYGNPSSIHKSGRHARTIIEDARKTVAKALNASIGEIFFTGSATEANNMLIRRAVSDLDIKTIVISSIEHPCVMNTALDLKESGLIELMILEVNEWGKIDHDQLHKILQKSSGKTLVSIMHVNNEIGVIQDIMTISKICSQNDALFHCDAVQAIGKLPIDLQEIHIDFLSGTSHKFHGPKGVGFMYIRNDHKIKPFITGGGQEREMRSGTENVYGIAGLAKALQIYQEDQKVKMSNILTLKNAFKSKLQALVPEVRYLEDQCPDQFIPTILSASFPETPKTELITFNLDIAGIAASAGSACASGVEQASHVLEAIQLPEDRRAVRFSFSYLNTMNEIEESVKLIHNMLK
ncbi:cysteine desulfurase family protein [Portibacter marinus]|uniref:cysteine desulfurase family protein n=1 Tax=Portibacter marinus TaxID=2898660 RepID=UPI001F3305E5|nr:cysteine desulfurase family protein [Portibacter marinus]